MTSGSNGCIPSRRTCTPPWHVNITIRVNEIGIVYEMSDDELFLFGDVI